MIRNINYYAFYVLDIETSTDYDEEGGPIRSFLSYGVISEYLIVSKSVRQTNIFRFRSWNELDGYLRRINRHYNHQSIIFVHNLAYEFTFLQSNLYNEVEELIALTSHKPIMVVFNNLSNIQFRCTYQLSGMSLSKMGKAVGVPKLESDYRYISPNDEVTEEEWLYCERDTLIPALFIEKQLANYDLNSLPYTKTGFVRKFFKDEYKRFEGNNCEWDQMPGPRQVALAEQAFYGGITISNPAFTGIINKNVRSFDETSAYPFVMLSEKFPRKIKPIPEMRTSFPAHYIAKVRINNIHSRYTWGWIPEGRMDKVGHSETFNGKILSATFIEGTFTDVDIKSIKMTYHTGHIEFIEGFACYDFQPLPECYLQTVFEFANKKTELKEKGGGQGVNIDLDFDYMNAKANLNSIYGMCVEKLIRSDWCVSECGEWEQLPGEYDYKDHVGRSFIFGVYITAYARQNLLKAIVTNCPTTFVYADTDSIKYIDEGKPFIDTNKSVPSNFPMSVQKMGRFDDEGIYNQFLTFGAKKYAFTKNGDGKVNLVIAGLPKMKDYPVKSIGDIKPGTVFEKCKLAHKYLPECALYPVDYTLDITENDREILELYKKLRREYEE